VGIDSLGGRPQAVTARSRADVHIEAFRARLAQQAPKPGDVALDRPATAVRWIAFPEQLGEPVGRHGLIGVNREDAEELALDMLLTPWWWRPYASSATRRLAARRHCRAPIVTRSQNEHCEPSFRLKV
jgi:hypothetical protein